MVCQLLNLTYYLHACYAILHPKGMGSGIQAIIKQMNFYQSLLCVEMSSIMVPWHMHVINGAIHKVRTQGKRRGRSFVKIRTRGEGGQIFDLFKCTCFIDAPNSCKY